MKPMQKQQEGMLANLMIAIIALTPSVAFSGNEEHAVRERVSEGLNIAGAAQTLVKDNARKAVPDFSQGWTSQELSGLNQFINSIRIDPASGVITVTYTELARQISISLTPSADGAGLVAGRIPSEDISWRCVVSDAGDNKFVPDNCRL